MDEVDEKKEVEEETADFEEVAGPDDEDLLEDDEEELVSGDEEYAE